MPTTQRRKPVLLIPNPRFAINTKNYRETEYVNESVQRARATTFQKDEELFKIVSEAETFPINNPRYACNGCLSQRQDLEPRYKPTTALEAMVLTVTSR